MKVQVRGVVYESVKEAAKALNVSQGGVYGAIERGKTDLLGLGKTMPQKVTIGNVEFRSMSAASVALGFSRRFIRDVRRAGGPKRKAMLDQAIAEFIKNREDQP